MKEDYQKLIEIHRQLAIKNKNVKGDIDNTIVDRTIKNKSLREFLEKLPL